eukprot:361422-Chlamydomonas_euryale.AAC.6
MLRESKWTNRKEGSGGRKDRQSGGRFRDEGRAKRRGDSGMKDGQRGGAIQGGGMGKGNVGTAKRGGPCKRVYCVQSMHAPRLPVARLLHACCKPVARLLHACCTRVPCLFLQRTAAPPRTRAPRLRTRLRGTRRWATR